MRDLKEGWADFFNVPPFREQTPKERRIAMFGGLVVLTIAITHYWVDSIFEPSLSLEKLKKIKKGMSQDEVLAILGEPSAKTPDYWTYKFNDEQLVRIRFGSKFKVVEVERVQKPRRDRRSR